MRTISHVGIGVRDMESSLRFYRDALGLAVIRDEIHSPPNLPGAWADDAQRRRREVFLRWRGDADRGNAFLSLNQHEPPAGNPPLMLDQLGIHHFSFRVDDVGAVAARLRAHGIPDFPVIEATGDKFGYPPDVPFLTFLVKDPDGNLVQFEGLRDNEAPQAQSRGKA
jgi:catechol 2,3-dioxygenase-like lactoylglutathione lyase family enzyme